MSYAQGYDGQHAHLDLCFDQLGVHLPVVDPNCNSYKRLSPLFRFHMGDSLRFRLNFDALHDERVKVQHCRLHDRFVRLKYEDDGDGAFRENFWRVESS